MSTNNFYNHENGIYVLQDCTEQEALELLMDINPDHAGAFSEEEISEEIRFQNDDIYNCFIECFGDYLEWKSKGTYSIVSDKKHNGYAGTVYNKQDKVVAYLRLEGGYYSGAQVIVETDIDTLASVGALDDYYDTNYDLLNDYTPNHKRLLKYLASYTTPIVRIGNFSNGEAIYELA